MMAKGKSQWFVAMLVERFELYKEARRKPQRQYTAYLNTHILKAKNFNEAYKKANAVGKANLGSPCVNSVGEKGHWVFEGIADLLPVYEPIGDGCEILWQKIRGRLVSIQSRIQSKGKLRERCSNDGSR